MLLNPPKTFLSFALPEYFSRWCWPRGRWVMGSSPLSRTYNRRQKSVRTRMALSHVPVFDVPFSSYMSEEAKRVFVHHTVGRPLASKRPIT